MMLHSWWCVLERLSLPGFQSVDCEDARGYCSRTRSEICDERDSCNCAFRGQNLMHMT